MESSWKNAPHVICRNRRITKRMQFHGILPAAGLAVRMRKLPKFLLPTDRTGITLIERHIENLEKYCEVIWLPVRPDLIQLVYELNLGKKVIPIPIVSQTMTETVLQTLRLSSADNFVLLMPDTCFIGSQPYSFLAEEKLRVCLKLALWKTAPSQVGHVGSVEIDGQKVLDAADKDTHRNFGQHWGAMSFDRNFLNLLDPEMPHTGYGIPLAISNDLAIDFQIFQGDYIDCGTFQEYRRLISHY